GGIVSEILVDVGDVVQKGQLQKGQLLARIDPADTLSVYNQAKADLEAANARIEQAQESLQLQREQIELALQQAEANLAPVSARLKQAQERARTQPIITEAQLQSARTNIEQLEKVTIPQEQAQAEANYNSARQQVEIAQRNYERLRSLLQKGYVAQQQVDNALAQMESARSQLVAAEKRLQTLETDIQARLETARARVREGSQSALRRSQPCPKRTGATGVGRGTRSISTSTGRFGTSACKPAPDTAPRGGYCHRQSPTRSGRCATL
ncbi:MAG: hypothetical protein C4336_03575, partial [Armatimonadota bacterium]